MKTTKLGIATAKAMDELERLSNEGEITEGSRIGAVVIIVALDSDTPNDAEDRVNLRDVQTQIFCFSEPEELYVQVGLLELARDNQQETD